LASGFDKKIGGFLHVWLREKTTALMSRVIKNAFQNRADNNDDDNNAVVELKS
jgi:hypothetical protein